MVDDFPSLEQDSDSCFQKGEVQTESDDDHEKTLRKAEKNKEKVMLKRKVNYDNIAREVRTASCCSKKCIQSILTISDIFKTREKLLKKPREVQGQFLLNFFQVARRSKGQKTVYVHTVEKKYVCQKAWIFSHGIAYGRYVLLQQ